jgi:hypothetical protein
MVNIMKIDSIIHRLCIPTVGMFASLLTACGGGGSSSNLGGAQFSELPPASGSYTPVITVDKATLVLSAAHSESPTTEYAWSSKTVNAAAIRVSYSGKIGNDGTVTDVQPFELSTIHANEIGNVSLIARGRPVYNTFAPQQKPCRFNAPEGWLQFRLDFTPNSGTLTDGVIMAGNDGVCGTADDGPATEEPIGEFYDFRNGDQASVFQSGIVSIQGKGSLAGAGIGGLGGGGTPRRVLNLDNASVIEDANGLYLLTMKDKATESAWDLKFDFVRLKTTTGWKSAGYDLNSLYLYRNTSTIGLGTWEFIQVTRLVGNNITLGVGPGTIEGAILSDNQVWISGANSNRAETHVLYKNLTAPKVTLSSSATVVKAPFVAGGGRVVVYAVRPGFSGLEIYSESNINTPVRSIAQSLLSGSQKTGVQSIRSSPAKAVIYVKTVSGISTGFSGGNLSSYDPVTDTEISYGTFPQGALGGANQLVGIPSINESSFKTFVLQGVDAGTQAAFAIGARKYSFQFGKANSLQELSRQYVLVP